ncbi:MAG: DUF6305 family protein [Candidatus Moduliflexus flocculans]|nr:DUF6305 family protein [Candidatus Moduliflexus flocculans]
MNKRIPIVLLAAVAVLGLGPPLRRPGRAQGRPAGPDDLGRAEHRRHDRQHRPRRGRACTYDYCDVPDPRDGRRRRRPRRARVGPRLPRREHDRHVQVSGRHSLQGRHLRHRRKPQGHGRLGPDPRQRGSPAEEDHRVLQAEEDLRHGRPHRRRVEARPGRQRQRANDRRRGPLADYIVVTKDSNKDGRFTKLAQAKKIPITEIEYALGLVDIVKQVLQ